MTVLGLATACALALVPLPAVAAHFGRVMAQLVRRCGIAIGTQHCLVVRRPAR